MSPLIGKRIEAQDGTTGTIVAVAHGGGSEGWHLLVLKSDGKMRNISASYGTIIEPEPLVASA